MNWMEAQKADEEALQQAALEALKASESRPLAENERMTLAYLGGIANNYWKELRK